jgi:RNA polymerase sigma factor (sigma-70 family)
MFVEESGMATTLHSASPQAFPRELGEPADLIPTRESLLSRLKDWEDNESWQDFFDTYWRLIYNMARKAGLPDAEAQDIVQETVISVARKIEGFRYDPAVCSFKSWMLRLTRWRIINQLKKRSRDHTSDQFRPPGTADAPDPPEIPVGFDLEAIWDQEWEKNLLDAALERVKRQVPPEQFQIFDLYCLEEWSAQKIARTLGVNVGRIYLAKHRVSRLLKKEILRLEKKSGS